MKNSFSYQESGVYFQPIGPDGKPVMGDNINQVTYTPPVCSTGGDFGQRLENAVVRAVDYRSISMSSC